MGLDLKQLGNSIKMYRLIHNFTQEDLAEHLQTSVRNVSDIENGKAVIDVYAFAKIYQSSPETIDPWLNSRSFCWDDKLKIPPTFYSSDLERDLFYEQFPERLRFIRRLKGFSQAKMARCLGLSSSAGTKMDNALKRFPITHLFKLADLFECHPIQLLLPGDASVLVTHPSSRILMSEWVKPSTTDTDNLLNLVFLQTKASLIQLFHHPELGDEQREELFDLTVELYRKTTAL